MSRQENQTCPSNANWEDDTIQFPRLIEEAQVAGAFTDEVIRNMAEVMDLEVADVVELLERARRKWEAVKSET